MSINEELIFSKNIKVSNGSIKYISKGKSKSIVFKEKDYKYQEHLKRKLYKKSVRKQKTRTSTAKVYKEYVDWKKTKKYTKWKKNQFLKQGGLCWYCQTYLPHTRQNVEHLIPMSRGGGNDLKNLVISCSSCNKKKGSNILSAKDRLDLEKINAKNKGTYVKNKASIELEQYEIIEMLSFKK